MNGGGRMARRTFEWLRNQTSDFYHKTFAVYLIVITVVLAERFVGPTVPDWPFGYGTGVWALALLFPLSAALYLFANLRTRLCEIDEVARAQQYPAIYFPDKATMDDAETAFSRFLRQRYSEYQNVLELAAWSLACGGVVFLGAAFAAVQFGLVFNSTDILTEVTVDRIVNPWEMAAGASFLGAVAGGLVTIARKYRTVDLYPSTYCQTTVAMTVGILTGGVIGAFATLVPGGYGQPAVPFLALASAFLTVVNVEFVGRFLRKKFAEATHTEIADDIPTDLPTVIKNSDAVASLTNISLWSVAEFVKADPLRLYLNLSQPIGVINGWLDEALVHYYFGATGEALVKAHIVRFSLLLEMVVETFDRPIVWRKDPRLTGDAEVDRTIAETVRAIVASRTHERAIAVIAPNFRRTLPRPPA